MIEPTNTTMMLFPLHMRLVERLLLLRAYPEEPLCDVVERQIGGALQLDTGGANESVIAADYQNPDRAWTKYSVEILGERIGASTLRKLLAAVVDFMQDLDPSVNEALSEKTTRRRHYIARTSDAVHPWSPHLPTWRAESGWWVSANVSREQVKAFLKVMCGIASLEFGTDVRFPAP